jgi:hypothetical protein
VGIEGEHVTTPKPAAGKRESCAACGKPAAKDQGDGFTCDDKEVPLCEACWSDGENNEAWNARIVQRIRDRRAGRKPAKPKKFSVMCTVKTTWSLRDVEAEDEDEAARKVEAMELDELDRYGHEIGCDIDIDSVAIESRGKGKGKVRK